MQHKPYNSPGPANLGRAAAPAKVDGDELAVMKNLAVTPAELQNRKLLLEKVDAFRKAAGQTNGISADTFHDRAFDVLASSKLVEALDVTKEPERTRERYGKGSPKHLGDGAPQWNDQLLMARRLVEAGCRVVTVAYGFWDTHGSNFACLKEDLLPEFDRGYSALLEDLAQRNLLDETLVACSGEFGRTPKINGNNGRDHWPFCYSAVLAGGGVQGGSVFGALPPIGTWASGLDATIRTCADAD